MPTSAIPPEADIRELKESTAHNDPLRSFTTDYPNDSFADKAAVIFDTKENVVWLIGLNSHSRIG
jgi:hypothetical protein